MQVSQRRRRLGHGIDLVLACFFPLSSGRLDKTSARCEHFSTSLMMNRYYTWIMFCDLPLLGSLADKMWSDLGPILSRPPFLRSPILHRWPDSSASQLLVPYLNFNCLLYSKCTLTHSNVYLLSHFLVQEAQNSPV